MTTKHKYAVGQSVNYQTPRRYSAAGGTYKIVGLLPERVYRIRSPAESHERAVPENNLAPAPDDAPTLAIKDWGRARRRPGKWK